MIERLKRAGLSSRLWLLIDHLIAMLDVVIYIGSLSILTSDFRGWWSLSCEFSLDWQDHISDNDDWLKG